MCVSNMEKEYLEYLKNELLEMALTNEDDKARKRLIEKEIPRNYVKLLAIADTHLGCYQDRRDILDYLANKVIQNDVDYVIHCGDVVDGVSSFQDQLDNLRYYNQKLNVAMNNKISQATTNLNNQLSSKIPVIEPVSETDIDGLFK